LHLNPAGGGPECGSNTGRNSGTSGVDGLYWLQKPLGTPVAERPLEDLMTRQLDHNIARLSPTLGFWSLSVSACLALACGGSNQTGTDKPSTDVTPATTNVAPPVQETCADNPLLAGCSTPAASGNAPRTAAPPPAATPSSDPAALAKAAAENVLAANCGQCHGPALTAQQAKAGMNYINDIDKLVETGKVIPLDSAGSRVIQRMVRGEMPPVNSGLPPVTDADIQTVSQYIDNPRFWPDQSPVSNCQNKDQLIDFDQLYQDLNADLRQADSKDRPFFRYISLANRFTSGVCADASLDKDRDSMTKMMNMLSVKATVGSAEPVDRDETLYRIDLRDFDWDRAVTVANQNFADVWEAIAANNPYAVEFVGDDADDAKADAVTAFPVMFADQMLDVAVIGNLYYGILGIDINQPLGDFISNQLGIDVQQDIIDEDTIRAGTTKSRISRQDRLVERHDIQVRGGAFWQSFDFEANAANQSIFQDPFGFVAGGSEAIFTLPNGMLGFIIADGNDAIVQDSDILLDTNQNNFKAVTAVSCSNCHATGFIPVVDEVASVALANARDIGLNQDEVQQLKSIYVSPEEFARQVQQDSQGFYQRALQLADLPTQGADPVSSVFLRFDQDVTLADAAGDLGLTPSDLLSNLDLLDPVLSVLKKGTLDRDDFTQLYVASLCTLSTPLNNQPVAAVCDAALAAIGN
jgi:mono/diheme cytochrome c family protein